MSFDFDLVIVGDSFEGIYAATAAIHFNARVALIASPPSPQYGSAESLNSRILARWATMPEPWETEGAAFSRAVIASIEAENSLETLAALGVDIVVGPGEFCRLPEQALIAGNRRLRSRAYLLATGSRPRIPPIDGLAEVGYLTPDALWQPENRPALPDRLAILGGSPLALELAQSLQRLGKEIALVVGSDRLLPAEDAEVERWIQAQLEAGGVRLLTRAPITQVRSIEGKKWLQAGNTAIEAGEIILAVGQVPAIEGLNLEGVGVTRGDPGLCVNDKLQTANPRIYACGSLLGGYPLAHLARYEAGIAVKNALFWPRRAVDYRFLPVGLFTEPNFARVGLSEARARQHYGNDAIAVRQYYKSIPQALVLEETTGFCKFVLHADGAMLGAHLVGPQAVESIAPLALALQQRLKIEALLRFPPISPSLSEIVYQTALQWERERALRPSLLKTARKSWLRMARDRGW